MDRYSEPGLLAGVEDLIYVGVIQSGGQAALEFEPCSVGGILGHPLGANHLQRHLFGLEHEIGSPSYMRPIPLRLTSASIR